MTEQDRILLRLALAFMSGRASVESISEEEFSLMGYDTYKFKYYGGPSTYDIQVQCEDIVFRLIEKLFTKPQP